MSIGREGEWHSTVETGRKGFRTSGGYLEIGVSQWTGHDSEHGAPLSQRQPFGPRTFGYAASLRVVGESSLLDGPSAGGWRAPASSRTDPQGRRPFTSECVLKKILAAAGRVPFIRRAFRPFLRNHASIFMLHRFADPETGVSGHDPERLQKALEYLRRENTRILPLADLLREGRTGGDISGAVAFTVDDGYFDIHAVAAPIFERYDCPVTVFLTTGFLDGRGWLWWDRIRFMLQETQAQSVELEIGGPCSGFQWGEADDRRRVAYQITHQLAEVTAPERTEAVDRLQQLLGTHVPDRPTPAVSPLTWDQVRDLGRRGFTFGPHTLTHPNLAELAEAEAVAEIEGSWSRVRGRDGCGRSDLLLPLRATLEPDEGGVGVAEGHRDGRCGDGGGTVFVGPGLPMDPLCPATLRMARHARGGSPHHGGHVTGQRRFAGPGIGRIARHDSTSASGLFTHVVFGLGGGGGASVSRSEEGTGALSARLLSRFEASDVPF